MSIDHIEKDGLHIFGLYPDEIQTIINAINFKWENYKTDKIEPKEYLIMNYFMETLEEYKKADQAD